MKSSDETELAGRDSRHEDSHEAHSAELSEAAAQAPEAAAQAPEAATKPKETEVLLVLPDPDEDEEDGRPSVVISALSAIESLDPTFDQAAATSMAGITVYPGRVPLALITFGVTITNASALVGGLLFASADALHYLLPFAIAHAIYFAHLWSYHVGYRSRRRFLLLRRGVFLVAFALFLAWMSNDQLVHNAPSPNGAAALWLAIVANISSAVLIFAHWTVLGRGYRMIRKRGAEGTKKTAE